MRARRRLALALCAGLLGLAGRAAAESALHVEYPESFGTIPAATYDAERHRVGDAHLVVERLDDGNVRIFSESGITGGARTVVTAELAPEPGGRWLTPLRSRAPSTPTGRRAGSSASTTAAARVPEPELGRWRNPDARAPAGRPRRQRPDESALPPPR